MRQLMQRFSPRTLLARSSSPIFSGEVASAGLLALTEDVKVSFVEFQPGSRTRWHVHDGDQLLIVAQGSALIGNREGSQRVETGQSILIKAGEEHFHSPTPDGPMAHYSVLAGSHTEILETVEL
jgi:quercetin dioxygenase-like cupin family protein